MYINPFNPNINKTGIRKIDKSINFNSQNQNAVDNNAPMNLLDSLSKLNNTLECEAQISRQVSKTSSLPVTLINDQIIDTDLKPLINKEINKPEELREITRNIINKATTQKDVITNMINEVGSDTAQGQALSTVNQIIDIDNQMRYEQSYFKGELIRDTYGTPDMFSNIYYDPKTGQYIFSYKEYAQSMLEQKQTLNDQLEATLDYLPEDEANVVKEIRSKQIAVDKKIIDTGLYDLTPKLEIDATKQLNHYKELADNHESLPFPSLLPDPYEPLPPATGHSITFDQFWNPYYMQARTFETKLNTIKEVADLNKQYYKQEANQFAPLSGWSDSLKFIMRNILGQ